MTRKRIKGLAYVCLIGIIILISRLAQIQLIDTEHFSKENINLLEASVRQRTKQVVIDNGRGKFYDKHGTPLTTEPRSVLILFPFLKEMDWNVEKVAEVIGYSPEQLLEQIKEAKDPVVFHDNGPVVLKDWQVEQINSLEIPGVFAVTKQFERPHQFASQLIGITGENAIELKNRYPDQNYSDQTVMGITGLEKSFDPFLIQDEQTKLVYHVDGRGGPLFGLDVKYIHPSNPFYPIKIITTLDFHIQKQLEIIADHYEMEKGGIVLLDIESNSIIANVSRPKIDEQAPYKNGGLINYMLKPQFPGSIFKTVIAAISIDYKRNSPSRTFDCSKTIHGEVDEVFDHGILTFRDSFAVSCNQTFATMAEEIAAIDPHLIESYAERFGLIDQVGWEGDVFHFQDFSQLADEERGQIFLSDTERTDPRLVRLVGIGQLNVKLTPLSVANMMASIARGGELYSVRAVSSIEYQNGTNFFSFPMDRGKRAVSPYTAEKLRQLLREVVVNPKGTARALQDLPYEVAGKTGTAETGKFVADREEQLVNKWFAGFFPFTDPKYALVVVQLDAKKETTSPISITKDIVNFLYAYDHN
ncbi:peptidoglycan D,D-transpeptidase FtsI family protein [Fervidibacillus halotolerans]|uniref:serine-type D-Ala-D-Ala carboxypeptidase n=1 Tax=Fervidibacillus halotolerans TaxID=2980027 RepID=A0A9E8RXV0_9BACI|nr:penicillin-binding transpeptidase domain-containing protein [Fervidibacillus halotolerans]WAA11538.1 penicillin-binding transpeptidase domain-containing protein [Fervidibacillus halotolerans]